MSLLETHLSPHDLELDYNKRLMLGAGRANPELAAKIASKLGVELTGVVRKTFANGEVYCRFEESVRGADETSWSSFLSARAILARQDDQRLRPGHPAARPARG